MLTTPLLGLSGWRDSRAGFFSRGSARSDSPARAHPGRRTGRGRGRGGRSRWGRRLRRGSADGGGGRLIGPRAATRSGRTVAGRVGGGGRGRRVGLGVAAG